jgi:hypothetical protein
MNEKECGKRSKTHFSIRIAIAVILLNVLVSTGTVYVYDRVFGVKIKAFDIRGYMAEQKKRFYAGKITEEELLSSLDRVEEVLNRESRNTLILNGDAVLRNGQFINP